jgi:predicted amidophosphoribosyltransferase
MKKRNGGFGGGRKKCGYCRAWVKYNAPFCPKCGYEFIQF